MTKTKSLQVRLWGKIVGYIAFKNNGIPKFVFEESFRSLNLDISPIEMPIDKTIEFTQQNSAHSFHLLPAIFSDSLPDSFGMRIIRDFYSSNYGLEEHEINVLNKLSYVGTSSVGALEFLPVLNSDEKDQSEEYLEIQKLRNEVKKSIEGRADIVTAQLMRKGGSPGGAHAKCLIDYNSTSNKIRNGFSKSKKNFKPCLIKFDGVRTGEQEGLNGRVEYIYSIMARECRIDFPQTYLLLEENRAHFIVERFDRDINKNKPYHYASLFGLLTKDLMQPHSCTYEEYLKLTSYLTNDTSQVLEAFKRIVFNIIFRNQDDHTKNFGFLMDKNGVWKIAPAFDLTFVYIHSLRSTHQMTLNGKDEAFTLEDLIKVGVDNGLKQSQVKKVVEEVTEVSKTFLELAEAHGLDMEYALGIDKYFRRDLLIYRF